MNIELNDGWFIKSSSRDFQLGKYKYIKKVDDTQFYADSYHGTIDQALNAYSNKRLLMSDANTWDQVSIIAKEIKTEIEDIKQVLTNILKEV